MVNKRIKIFTSEAAVHSQINTLEKILARRIEFEVAINVKDTSPNIQFDANDIEIQKIRTESDFNVLVRQGGYWLPVI